MPFHFCSQCGTKLEPDFRFCPSCGVKLPSLTDESAVSLNASLNVSPHRGDVVATSVAKEKLSSSRYCEPRESTVTTRPALQKTRNSLRLDREHEFNLRDAAPPPVVHSADPVKDYSIGDNRAGFHKSPVKQHTVTFKVNAEVKPTTESSTSPSVKSPRPGRAKAKLLSPALMPVEEGKNSTPKSRTRTRAGEATVADSPDRSPVPSSIGRSPLKASGKSKAKKAKNATVDPMQEGEEVTDTTGRKWTLMRLSNQTITEVIYEVLQTGSRSKETNHILKLGLKDGKIFNEQNFLQRAAKPSNVEKWIKQNKMDFLGIPSCVGFGLHDSYRFLIFPNMGQSLQSVLDEDDCLSEKAVLQLACRLLDVLQYIHSNEYVHADINADNIYITAGHTAQVYLVGYCHAYRYCPGGQHVEYREDSRTPHEGSIEFISLDAHKGAAPSRRSDLQSLGYCMLRWHTGTLPWKDLSRPEQVAASKQRFMDDVPALLTHCFGKTNVSRAFQMYLSAVMCLQYSEQPDYSELKSGLGSVLLQMGGSVEQPLTF